MKVYAKFDNATRTISLPDQPPPSVSSFKHACSVAFELPPLAQNCSLSLNGRDSIDSGLEMDASLTDIDIVAGDRVYVLYQREQQPVDNGDHHLAGASAWSGQSGDNASSMATNNSDSATIVNSHQLSEASVHVPFNDTGKWESSADESEDSCSSSGELLVIPRQCRPIASPLLSNRVARHRHTSLPWSMLDSTENAVPRALELLFGKVFESGVPISKLHGIAILVQVLMAEEGFRRITIDDDDRLDPTELQRLYFSPHRSLTDPVSSKLVILHNAVCI